MYGKMCRVIRALSQYNLSVLFVARMYNDYGEKVIGETYL